jgi:hypothetical protein
VYRRCGGLRPTLDLKVTGLNSTCYGQHAVSPETALCGGCTTKVHLGQTASVVEPTLWVKSQQSAGAYNVYSGH